MTLPYNGIRGACMGNPLTAAPSSPFKGGFWGAGEGASGGRLRAPPVADTASNKDTLRKGRA